MFASFEDDPPPPSWEPPPEPRPRLSAKEGRVLAWLVGGNAVMLLLAPLAGASLVQAVIALLR
jgi:hypothetical protein